MLYPSTFLFPIISFTMVNSFSHSSFTIKLILRTVTVGFVKFYQLYLIKFDYLEIFLVI